jgi:hypothetical protein
MKKKKRDSNDDLDIFACDNCQCIHLRAGDLDLQLSPEDFLEFRDRVNEVSFEVDRHALLRDRARFERYRN